MTTERVVGQNNGEVDSRRYHNLFETIKNVLLERRLARRAKEINEHTERSEESQRVTSETMHMMFHGPGEG